jgi:hypothetical protein
MQVGEMSASLAPPDVGSSTTELLESGDPIDQPESTSSSAVPPTVAPLSRCTLRMVAGGRLEYDALANGSWPMPFIYGNTVFVGRSSIRNSS